MATSHSSAAASYSPFLPIALFLAATLAWSAFQWRQLADEKKNLNGLIVAQQPQLDQAHKLQRQLDSIAAGMKKLANDGNANAKLVVDELRKRGVTIANETPAAAAAP